MSVPVVEWEVMSSNPTDQSNGKADDELIIGQGVG